MREIWLTHVDPGLLTWLLEVEGELVGTDDILSGEVLNQERSTGVSTLGGHVESIVSGETKDTIDGLGDANLGIDEEEFKTIEAAAKCHANLVIVFVTSK